MILTTSHLSYFGMTIIAFALFTIFLVLTILILTVILLSTSIKYLKEKIKYYRYQNAINYYSHE